MLSRAFMCSLLLCSVFGLAAGGYAVDHDGRHGIMRKDSLERSSAMERDHVQSEYRFLVDATTANGGKLADGCQHVFLDVGANRGVHVRSLFEPDKYESTNDGYWKPAAKQSEAFKFFAQFVANRSHDHSVCAFGFEANPDFTDRLHALETVYQKLGWTTKFFTASPVSNQTGEVAFWRELHGPQLSGQVRATSPSLGNVVEVKERSMDLAQFLGDHIMHRTLPMSNQESYVVMKMDIEGSEFTVLPHLLKHGALCKKTGIDAISMEWHGDGKTGNQVGAGPGAAALAKEIASQGNGCIGTDLLDVNDESAFNDEQALPTGDALPAILNQ